MTRNTAKPPGSGAVVVARLDLVPSDGVGPRRHLGHRCLRRAPTLNARPTAAKNTSTAVPP